MISSKRNFSSRWGSDAPLIGALAAVAAVTGLILVLIIAFLIAEAWPVLVEVGPRRFLTDDAWHPVSGAFGLAPMLAASLAVAAGALVLAAPLGVGSALFVRCYASGLVASVYRWMIILLGGLPSVVLGLWGLTVVVPLLARIEPPGANLLAGMLVLALMIAPTIALTTEAALAALPARYMRGATSLGLSREAIIVQVLLPAARGSILAGALLALARALGETMVVLMVTGNVVQAPTGLFQPMRTLTANIALEMAYAVGDHRASLFVSGVALTALVLALVLMARRFGGRRLYGARDAVVTA